VYDVARERWIPLTDPYWFDHDAMHNRNGRSDGLLVRVLVALVAVAAAGLVALVTWRLLDWLFGVV
jgi:hypothetical protein